MRIVFFIDSLGSGGAQRQLVELALGLRERAHDVHVLYYENLSFFAQQLEDSGVKVLVALQNKKWENIRSFRRIMLKLKPDVVQAYLHGPGAIAEIAGFLGKSWKLVATERSIYNERFQKKLTFVIGRYLHLLADWVVVNSHSNLELLRKCAPYLKKKTSVIINCVDLDRFHPTVDRSPMVSGRYEFICVGSMASVKNAPNIIRALALLRDRLTKPFRLRWLGRYEPNLAGHIATMNETLKLVEEFGLADHFQFLGERGDVENYLRESDALILCSKFEGLPNAVCEAMATGLPIVASRVSDNQKLVKEGVNGFLCDPLDISSMADAFKACMELSPETYAAYGQTSRRMAEEMFSRKRYIDEYEDLYKSLLGQKS